ncbi:MAG: zf-HC2 domain-containing protein, partial [Actinomycetota bacterium]|nr:zf-HC2 domain-containing protein [Actinomycetota bacterium]
MRSEARCDEIRVDLSARMDGEVDAARSAELDRHLDGCMECRRYEASLRHVKRAVRLQPAGEVPDLTERIMAAIAADNPVRTPNLWRTRLRIALVAAAIGALVVAGASLPRRDAPPDTALASAIADNIRRAARELTNYHARYEITERGWHPQVSQRNFSAEVWFSAPESFRLRVRDHTDYPGIHWPVNDVDLVADRTSWWIREPSSCPAQALPGCAIRPSIEE